MWPGAGRTEVIGQVGGKEVAHFVAEGEFFCRHVQVHGYLGSGAECRTIIGIRCRRPDGAGGQGDWPQASVMRLD